MGFEKVYITKQGALLAAKTLQGKKIQFDHAEIGSGELNEDAKDKTALTTKVLECEISKIEVVNDTQASVSFIFKNTDAQNAFYFREIGLFAIDPDTKEKVLYAYINAGDKAEYINNSNAEKIEKHIQINVVVDNTSNITITLDSNQIYVTEEELQNALNNLKTKIVTEPNLDIDNFMEDGCWYFSAYLTPLHAPDGVKNGWLRVLKGIDAQNRKTAKHIWLRHGGENSHFEIYVRTKLGEEWSEFQKIPTLNDIYPVGSIYISSTNTNPASALGGTWELVDKDFKELTVNVTDDDTYFTRNKTNTSTVSVVITRKRQDLFLRITATVAVDISDSAIEIGTLNLEKLGITSMYTMQNVAYSDGGNGIAFCSLNGTTGVLDTVDRLTRTNVDIPAGQNFAVCFNQPIRTNLMLDEACDKFYWKRTA